MRGRAGELTGLKGPWPVPRRMRSGRSGLYGDVFSRRVRGAADSRQLHSERPMKQADGQPARSFLSEVERGWRAEDDLRAVRDRNAG